MAVGGCLAVDRVAEFQTILYRLGTEREQGLDFFCDLIVAQSDMALSVGVHIDTHRVGHTDGVAQLNQNLVGHTGSHHVLGDMTCRIGSRAVHLRGVLAAESAAAVSPLASVSVHDDLTACQAGVAVGTTNHELACGIHVVCYLCVEQSLHRLALYLRHHPRYQDLHHVAPDLLQHRCVGSCLG